MEQSFAVYAWNWPVFEIWAQVWRQWRWIAGGFAVPQRSGLDWCQVEAVMRMRGVKKRHRAELMVKLKVMEDAAIETLATLSR